MRVCGVVMYVPRSAELDAAARVGLGDGTRREFGRGLNKERGLGTKVLHLVREYRSPNWDQE